jgi:hypothetical protein
MNAVLFGGLRPERVEAVLSGVDANASHSPTQRGKPWLEEQRAFVAQDHYDLTLLLRWCRAAWEWLDA